MACPDRSSERWDVGVATEVDLSPGSEAWGRLVSASKVPQILGMSPWGSPLSLWYEMKGLVDRDTGTSDAMVRGNLLEDAILNWWLYHKHEDEAWSLETQVRSEKRRVGKECEVPCRSRWSPYH